MDFRLLSEAMMKVTMRMTGVIPNIEYITERQEFAPPCIKTSRFLGPFSPFSMGDPFISR